MSIMLVNTQPEVIEKDLNTLQKFLNRYGYKAINESIVNCNYNLWLDLNVKSYNSRYNENAAQCKTTFISEVGNGKYDNYCELLKRLECIFYNIEIPEPDTTEKRGLQLLEDTIKDLKNYIISELTEYKEASWS